MEKFYCDRKMNTWKSQSLDMPRQMDPKRPL